MLQQPAQMIEALLPLNWASVLSWLACCMVCARTRVHMLSPRTRMRLRRDHHRTSCTDLKRRVYETLQWTKWRTRAGLVPGKLL